MQDLEKALGHLADIHSQMSRTEYYRGLNSVPVALTGVVGLCAAWLQSVWLVPHSAFEFVLYWATVACLNVGFIALRLGFDYLHTHTPFERRKTHDLLWQFLPSLLAGLLLTVVVLSWAEPVLLHSMPGLWALLFALGIFSTRPFFPKRVLYLGIFYLLAAAWLLSLAPNAAALVPWYMGLLFGGGQLLSALLIYWDMERQTEVI